MAAFLSISISAVLQVAAFSLIPLAWHLATARTTKGFLSGLGLKKPPFKSVLAALAWVAVSSALLPMMLHDPELMAALRSPHSPAGQLGSMGWSPAMAAALLVKAFIQTGLSEEIFFRGFLTKRLISWLGFPAGNLLQALLFGAIHAALFAAVGLRFSGVVLVIVVIKPAVAAWVMGWLNERWADGSIVPGWLMHGFGNAISYAAIVWTSAQVR